MKSAAVFATLLASAAAFAPQQQQQAASSTALNADFTKELGAIAPLGFFDPLGLVEDGNQEKFDRLRYVEIKHGRIAMLGVVGYLVNKAGIYLPGDINYSGTKFSDLGSGWAASEAVGGFGALQVFAFIGVLEIAFMKDATGENEFVGDFRNGLIDFGWDKQSDEWKMNKRTIELNQGRAAQMGMLGLMVHDKLGNLDVLGVPPSF